ncbi:MAG: hypothetical protein ABR878_09290 [Roseiarcus sp.]|jgi:hypothetical protein
MFDGDAPQMAMRKIEMKVLWTRRIDGAYFASSRSAGGRFREVLAAVVAGDGEDQMCVRPNLRALFGPGWRAVDVREALRSLESEFYLPMQAMDGEDLIGGTGLRLEQGRRTDGQSERTRLQPEKMSNYASLP